MTKEKKRKIMKNNRTKSRATEESHTFYRI
jgi:hypothetical protein